MISGLSGGQNAVISCIFENKVSDSLSNQWSVKNYSLNEISFRISKPGIGHADFRRNPNSGHETMDHHGGLWRADAQSGEKWYSGVASTGSNNGAWPRMSGMCDAS